MNKITVAIHSPNPTDSTSLYRAWGPWSQLKDQCEFIWVSLTQPIWPTLSTVDVLFLQRPTTKPEFDFMDQALEMGIPVWLDYDDDLFNLDPSNKAFEFYLKDDIIKNIKKALPKATLVSVSTNHIAEVFSAHSKNVVVIENEIPINLLKEDMLGEIPYNNTLACWRGTDHHVMNIVHFRDAFAELAHSQMRIVFMGFRPYPIREFFQPGQMMEVLGMNQWQYFQKLRNIKAAVHMVPLKECSFNKGKSNIAYQEALLFGRSLCVVPNLPEWNAQSGVIVYEQDQFADKVKQAYNMTDKARMSLTKLARRQLLASLHEFKGREKRLEILKSL